MAGQVNLGRVVGENGQGVPTGGSVGQALVKKSTSNYDTEWKTMVPTGGSAGQTLVKRTSTNYDTEWGTLNTAMPESIAIVANGNTHVAITTGQYVYARGHATLSEGLYTATAAIPANEILSASNLTAVPSGGLNALNTRIVGGISSVSATDDTNTITVPRDGIYLVSLVGQKQSADVGVHKILLNNAFLIGAATNNNEQFVNISFPLACHRNDVISFSTTVPFISNYADYMSYLMIAYITPAS